MGVLSFFPANPKGQPRVPHLLQEGLTSALCAHFCSPQGGSGGQGRVGGLILSLAKPCTPASDA